MDTLSFKTISANKATVNKEWVIVDAEGQTLGRLCAKVAKLLRGKYKPNFTPHVDCGDNVIIINADKIVLTGNKWNDRIYLRYTGYPGGQIAYTPADLQAKGDDRLFRKVVKGMLPNGFQVPIKTCATEADAIEFIERLRMDFQGNTRAKE